jgi:hypothetical protein
MSFEDVNRWHESPTLPYDEPASLERRTNPAHVENTNTGSLSTSKRLSCRTEVPTEQQYVETLRGSQTSIRIGRLWKKLAAPPIAYDYLYKSYCNCYDY